MVRKTDLTPPEVREESTRYESSVLHTVLRDGYPYGYVRGNERVLEQYLSTLRKLFPTFTWTLGQSYQLSTGNPVQRVSDMLANDFDNSSRNPRDTD